MARKRVVTERDVARAARERLASLDVSGAVVTPSARDAARQQGIVLSGSGASERGNRGAGPNESAGKRDERDEARAGSPSPNAARQPDGPSATSRRLRIVVGADHGGVAMKDAVASRLRELGHEVTDVGTSGSAAVDYPDFAAAVARRVADGRADFGVMVDGAGIGSCMAANKVPGVRAAMCYDVTTAVNAREHNDARVVTLGGGLIGQRLALAIVETFVATPFGGGRHAARVAKIDALDRGN